MHICWLAGYAVIPQENTQSAAFVASCEANRIDDIIVEIHNAGLDLVTIHDRPDGSAPGSYRYIIEAETGRGGSGEQLREISEVAGIRFIGAFDVTEK